MDIFKALEGQLDELQNITKWVVAFAFTATILTIQGDDPISVLALSLSRTEAFFILCIVYTGICVAALARFYRISTLLQSIDSSELQQGFAQMSIHKWIFNPFVLDSNDSKKSPTATHTTTGLVALFWFCLVGLFVLLPREAFGSPLAILFDKGFMNYDAWVEFGTVIGYLAFLGLPVTFGWLALLALLRIPEQLTDRIREDDIAFRAKLTSHQQALKKGTDRGIGIGGLAVGIAVFLRFGVL